MTTGFRNNRAVNVLFGRGRPGNSQGSDSGRRAPYNLSGLLSLTRDLSILLAPVTPRAEFRDQLYADLLHAGRQKQARQTLALASSSVSASGRLPDWLRQEDGRVNRRWVIGAAAVGSAVSVASAVVAIVLHQRGRDSAAA